MTDPTTIHNWYRLDARLTTSGQPTEAQLASLPSLGIHHVINLGLHSSEHALPDEAARCAAAGLRYIHIPVAFDHPTEEDFAQFRTALESLPGVPVHVHCIANYRVSAFFYRYRREILGMNEALARKDLEAVWRPDAVWSNFIGYAKPQT
jgi:uncharacterized protein (TIGR01244 family)